MKPSFQAVVDKQRIADHRIKHDQNIRSEPEIANYRRVMQPVPVIDVSLPMLPLVRMPGDSLPYVLLGAIAQTPDTVVLFCPKDGHIHLAAAKDYELVPTETVPKS